LIFFEGVTITLTKNNKLFQDKIFFHEILNQCYFYLLRKDKWLTLVVGKIIISCYIHLVHWKWKYIF